MIGLNIFGDQNCLLSLNNDNAIGLPIELRLNKVTDSDLRGTYRLLSINAPLVRLQREVLLARCTNTVGLHLVEALVPANNGLLFVDRELLYRLKTNAHKIW